MKVSKVVVCVFSLRAINITTKSHTEFRPIASKNDRTAQRFPQFLKVGTVYKCGLKVGFKICLKDMTVCKWFCYLANVVSIIIVSLWHQ